MYDTPLEAFTVFDLARSLRQDIHVRDVLPYCLRALQQNALAGELFDGELLTAVLNMPPDFWAANPKARDAVLRIADAALEEMDDEELRADIDAWVIKQRTYNIAKRPGERTR